MSLRTRYPKVEGHFIQLAILEVNLDDTDGGVRLLYITQQRPDMSLFSGVDDAAQMTDNSQSNNRLKLLYHQIDTHINTVYVKLSLV